MQNIVYTNFLTILYSNLSPITLDYIPKSIDWLNIFKVLNHVEILIFKKKCNKKGQKSDYQQQINGTR